MPGKGTKSGGGLKSKKHFKAKHQKKRFFRSKDPILAVLMWGVQHSVNEITTGVEPSLLLPEDFKAFSKLKVENQYYNKELLPGHFKFKEYCPRVFHDLRKRFKINDIEYRNSLITNPPAPFDSPGRSGAKFFQSFDRKLVVKSITGEEVALLHQILQQYHAHVVTTEGQTLLPQYLGMYRLTVNNAETYWMVMRNVCSSSMKMHIKFDLKGSTVDRQASDKEKAKVDPVFKDVDFATMGEKITIGEEAKQSFMSKLESDVQLLQKLNLMDYSLLVGIHDCTIPLDPEEEEWEEEEISSDDIGDGPQSPATPGDYAPELGNLSPEEGTSSDVPSPVATSPLPTTTSPHSPQSDEPQAELSSEPLESADQATATALSDGETGATYIQPATVRGPEAVEAALEAGMRPVIDQNVDMFAIASPPGAKPQVYYMGLIDVLTIYGARKRAAHAAKTMKHGAGAEISTVKPEQYARRFLDFLYKNIC